MKYLKFKLLLLSTFGLFYQNILAYHGQILNENKQAIAFANVLLLQNSDSTFVAGTTTDSLGIFSIDAPDDFYLLKISCLGYKTIFLSVENQNIGQISLLPDENVLQEIVVLGERPIMKIEDGKLVYDIQSLIKNKTVSNVYEALKALPGVLENNGILTLAGAGNLNIILNGKPTTMTLQQVYDLLKSTPAANIEKVEIMYSTPPQYHLRGASVNLIVKKADANTLQAMVRTGFESNYYSSYSDGANWMYSTRKNTIYANYSVNFNKYIDRSDLFSHHTLDDVSTDIEQNTTNVSQFTRHLLHLENTYSFNPKNTISVSFTTQFSPKTHKTADSYGNIANSFIERDGKNQMHNLSVHYASGFGFSAGADYTFYNIAMRQKLANENGDISHFTTVSGQNLNRMKLYADQIYKLADNMKLTCGASFSFAKDNDFQTYNEPEMNNLNTNSQINESTFKAYSGVSKNFGDKISLSFSLTAEYYRLENYKKWTVFPQANANFTIDDNNSLQFSFYSEKIYPSYWDTQESVSYLNWYEQSWGNTALRPYNMYNFLATYYFKQKYIARFFSTFNPDYFASLPYQDSEKLALIYQTSNWTYNNYIGANCVVPLEAGKIWSSSLLLGGFYNYTKNENFHNYYIKRNKFVGQIHLDNAIKISKNPDISLNLIYGYCSPVIQGIYDIDAMQSLDAGLTWKFAKGNAVLSAKCNDIFASAKIIKHICFANQKFDGFDGYYLRTFSINFSYKFGNYEQRQTKRIDTSRFGH